MEIYHHSQETEYRTPFGAARAGSSVRLALRIKAAEGEPLTDRVYVRTWQDEAGEHLFEMRPQETGGGLYERTLLMPEETGLLWYYFIVEMNGHRVYYGNNPAQLGGAGCTYNHEPPSYQITVYDDAPVPSWYKDGIVYQIFPDRFARDDAWEGRCRDALATAGDRKGQGKFIEEDWKKPAYYIKDEAGNVTDWPFYGGSLKGIEEKLPYLKSLGVSVLYLNPIFEAASNHRYDTGDYKKIDPMLGTKEDFRELAEAARECGIRIILDGVFSHTGADSLYFDKYGNYGGEGAYGSPQSPYRSWYEFREDDPVGYRSWWGVRDLPEVNEMEPSYVDYICGADGVLDTWLRMGASGWRLDVADELPDAFIRKIRERIKQNREDNLLLGEVWEDASNKISYGEKRQYLMGHELDSTMNYPLRDILLGFTLGEMNAGEASARIMSLAENYPQENFYGALNLIGSHDRRRTLTVLGAETDYGRAAALLKMLAGLQYTLPGVPCIYYGDEAGMTGGEDPSNRDGYCWGNENEELRVFYRQLGVLYREHPVLQSGALRMVDTGQADVLGFIREGARERILVLANRSWDNRAIRPEQLTGVLDGAACYALELLGSQTLAARDGRLAQDVVVYGHSVAMVLLLEEAPKSFAMKRSAGVICHLSSIPGGKLGQPARDFVDYLVSAGMGLWQILPLNPPGLGDSPYSSPAAFAGDPGLVNEGELPELAGLTDFCETNRFWLEDYIWYVSVKETGSADDESVARRIREEQYCFHVQWQALKHYANERGVAIIGDLPVFVSSDSADVMANAKLFQMEEGVQKVHAGVPPDYFTPEGQDWGNPLYDWTVMKEDGYRWWTNRLCQALERYDYVRLDHFRSFSEYFAVPQGEKPLAGLWQKGPGMDFFKKVAEALGGSENLRIMAEDLGILDANVYNLLKLTGLPGMNVWQFSAEEMEAMAAEEAARRVFYTGTHDNQTLMGWCREQNMDAGDALRVIRRLYESDAPWVILQVQDLFMLGDEARMNVPGVPEGNWKWKLPGNTIEEGFNDAGKIAAGFRSLAKETGRLGAASADERRHDE